MKHDMDMGYEHDIRIFTLKLSYQEDVIMAGLGYDMAGL
jgi:hypothetical protein